MTKHSTWLFIPLVFGILCSACNHPSSSTSQEDENDEEIQPVREINLRCNLEIKLKGGVILASLEFTNMSDSSLPVLKRTLLAEGEMNFPAFDVRRDGKHVTYTGMVAKRGRPRRKDWVILGPGESFQNTIRISDYYDFSPAGTYEVFYLAGFDPFGIVDKNFTEIRSNTVKLSLHE
jgi:hypothetical protein